MIIHGDCLDELKKLPDNSVDSVVTDPPYGLSKEPDITEVLTKWMSGEDYHHRSSGFMGKTWDSFVPGPAIWKEVYRVLKPGGHILCFAGTRTQDLMTIALRLAGFEVRDVLEWLYFSGFPKSMDIGKAFDKLNNRSFDDRIRLAEHIKEQRQAAGITKEEVNLWFGYRDGCQHWERKDFNGNRVPTVKDWQILKERLDLSNDFAELVYRIEAERKKVGEKKGLDGFVFDRIGGGETPSHKVIDITAPSTELAKQYDGWGTALKPSHEPIILARKPLEKTVAYNVEKYGTGSLNIDANRIPGGYKWRASDSDKSSEEFTKWRGSAGDGPHEKGRFPANCITLDDDQFYSKYFNIANITPQELSKKASKKDRNSDWKSEEVINNKHCTVKNSNLMAWLIRLITPVGGTVLDPFAGSGSTLVAAKREGFGFIGIEKEAEYIDIIQARIS